MSSGDLAPLRAELLKMQAVAEDLDVRLAASTLDLAKLKHDQASLRSGLLACLDELDRLDPQGTKTSSTPRR